MSDRIESLVKVSEIWLNPEHPLREETIQALQVSTGQSRRQIDMALTNCFEELTAAKIDAYVTSLELPKKGPIRVLHILPSNVFTAWVHGAVTTLLLGHRCLLKPSMREPIFARAWKKSLEEVDPALSRQVEIVAWDEKHIHSSYAVVAYGSDETLQKIQALLPQGVRFAGYGHKLSVGIIFQEAMKEDSWENLLGRIRNDAEPFRLQGCLSPQILYIENYQRKRWPTLEGVLDVPPKIRSFENGAAALQNIRKFIPYLSCVGYAGSPERAVFLEQELKQCDLIRVCPIGEMQRPPLTWRNGGINLADLLN